ncbi:acetyl-CoA carboxylase [Spizellomyces sp. 'palustris']|nr:acetyl-CoA carboxylase [Spizellomyces sp. 'palustris']
MRDDTSQRRLHAIKEHLQDPPHKTHKLLIANRSEIAIRIAHAASALDFYTIGIYTLDDAECLHVKKCDEAVRIGGSGVSGYLDIEGILGVCRERGVWGVHPGYGFLSENQEFARRCEEEGIVFVGPSPEMLGLFGDKLAAKALATSLNIPTLKSTTGPTTLSQTLAFQTRLSNPIMIKSIHGGGGRGMRIVHDPKEIPKAYTLARLESERNFGCGDVYVEEFLGRARHVEVQVIGDGRDVVHCWERECTLQRRNQKIVEVAPCPGLEEGVRMRIVDAAVKMAKAGKYKSLGTFEFLLSPTTNNFYFLETNPRIQVEHTITEETTRIDLVQTQLSISLGHTLGNLGLTQVPIPTTYAIQFRINAETYENGDVIPSFGCLKAFDPPSGRGIRVDTAGYAGYTFSSTFDSLLAKLVVFDAPSYTAGLDRAYRALREFRIEGVQTNVGVLESLCVDEEVRGCRVWTRYIEERGIKPLDGSKMFFEKRWVEDKREEVVVGPEGSVAVRMPMHGVVVTLNVEQGDTVSTGQELAIISAMKMEHAILSPHSGVIASIPITLGSTLEPSSPILFITPTDSTTLAPDSTPANLDTIRPDLADLFEQRRVLTDEARVEAVRKRHEKGKLTAWENVVGLVDEGSWIEYGSLAVAAQSSRRSEKELTTISPRDGVLTGFGTINAHLFPTQSRAAVIAYDYTVFAGTQGYYNHMKQDRILHLVHKFRMPLVVFCEGGGGRPGDVDTLMLTGLNVPTFHSLAQLSSKVPTVGIASGNCFAGNAALLSMCDVVIATEDACIGMGGPAMVEGGGLGRVKAKEIGPVDVQVRNGVIDALVKTEQDAITTTKQYLSYLQGRLESFTCADQRSLRHAIPENRKRSFAIGNVIKVLADTNSILELQKGFGEGVVTCFIRIEGWPFGLVANNSQHLSGAIDSSAATKMTRFIRLCDRNRIPMISLCDTPGFMVGPEAEKTGQVRRFGDLFVAWGVILRKAYGLGAQAMASGSLSSPFFSIAWPTGEFGAMGLEGAVRLGFKKELEGDDGKVFERLVQEYYDKGRAVRVARGVEIDQVIDPAETRQWVLRGFLSCGGRMQEPTWQTTKT